jgi:hypothetical protein
MGDIRDAVTRMGMDMNMDIRDTNVGMGIGIRRRGWEGMAHRLLEVREMCMEFKRIIRRRRWDMDTVIAINVTINRRVKLGITTTITTIMSTLKNMGILTTVMTIMTT